MKRELANLMKEKYANLSAWNTVLVARHPARPQTMRYESCCDADLTAERGAR